MQLFGDTIPDLKHRSAFNLVKGWWFVTGNNEKTGMNCFMPVFYIAK
jgi:hypothetical protein